MDHHPPPEPSGIEPQGSAASRHIDRRALAAALGTGIVTVGAWRVGFAQVSDDPGSTPEVTVSGTPAAGDGDDTLDTGRISSTLEEIDTSLVLVQADRDAVASSIDPATIDAVLADAAAQRAAAQTALDGDDAALAQRFTQGAWLEVKAARTLIEAQLSYAGLPSQQPRARQVLIRAHERITASGEAAGTDPTMDISFQVATAEELYAVAYEQYGSGSFAQASLTAQGASGLAQAGLALVGEGGCGGLGGFGERGPMPGDHAMDGDGPDSVNDETYPDATPTTDDATDTPPAPDFGT